MQYVKFHISCRSNEDHRQTRQITAVTSQAVQRTRLGDKKAAPVITLCCDFCPDYSVPAKITAHKTSSWTNTFTWHCCCLLSFHFFTYFFFLSSIFSSFHLFMTFPKNFLSQHSYIFSCTVHFYRLFFNIIVSYFFFIFFLSSLYAYAINLSIRKNDSSSQYNRGCMKFLAS